MPSIADRSAWATLRAQYDPDIALHRPNFEVSDLEQCLAALTPSDIDELVGMVVDAGADQLIAHELLVVLARRFDARIGEESRRRWERTIIDEGWAARARPPIIAPAAPAVRQSFKTVLQVRLPMADGGALLIGPGTVVCDVRCAAQAVKDAESGDGADILLVDLQLTDADGRVYRVSAQSFAGSLWEWAGNREWSRHFLSRYQPIVTGLRCANDGRSDLVAPGFVGHVPRPRAEYLKHRLFIMDVYAGEEGRRPWLVFVVRRHFSTYGMTSQYVLQADHLSRSILHDDYDYWSIRSSKWGDRRAVATDDRGDPQESVRAVS
jgi:hypothetical protein